MARDPYEYFRIEARELLDQIGKGALDLERGAAAPGHVAHLLRAAHTLKGAARVVRQREIAEIAHAIEDALVPFRSGGEQSARAIAAALLERVDAASALVAKLGSSDDPAVADARSVADDRPLAPRAGSEDMGALIDSIAEVGMQLAKMRRVYDPIARTRQLAGLLAAELRAAGETGRERAGLVGEMQGLLESIQRDLTTGLEQADRDLRQTREAADRMQLVPVGIMFHALERAVRDAALASGKRVAFTPAPSDLRIEPDVLGALQNALLHVVRNAVAHGIEAESARAAQGKPPEGRVTLDVVRLGRRVSFVCSDDGRGIDLEAVRRAVRSRGVSEDEARELRDDELARMLLEGGISTSGTVTEVSGRGVGLDVVREAAVRLGGEVAIRTESRCGTAVQLTIPLRASAIDVLFVVVGEQAVALPLESVRGTLGIRRDLLVITGGAEKLLVEGKMLSFAPLARVLGRASAGGVSERRGSAVVVGSRDRLCAVGVDRLVGIENVVVRALPDTAPARKVVAGVCLDMAGDPQLIVDAEGVLEEVHRAVAVAGEAKSPPAPILIVDDSLTTRMLEQSILESAGYRVDVAISGEEGLVKARACEYGLYLVDVEMPGMDGFTFVERTRADPALRKVPAILVTSRASVEDKRRGQLAGAQGYMVKSEFDQRELLDRIRSLLS